MNYEKTIAKTQGGKEDFFNCSMLDVIVQKLILTNALFVGRKLKIEKELSIL